MYINIYLKFSRSELLNTYNFILLNLQSNYAFPTGDIKQMFPGIENRHLVWNKHNLYWHIEIILIRPVILNELATHWNHMGSLKK